MTSERSKRRDFLSLIFIAKSISKKLLIKMSKGFLKFCKHISHLILANIIVSNLKNVYKLNQIAALN